MDALVENLLSTNPSLVVMIVLLCVFVGGVVWKISDYRHSLKEVRKDLDEHVEEDKVLHTELRNSVATLTEKVGNNHNEVMRYLLDFSRDK